MDVRILGPLAVLDGGREVTPRRAQPRILLAFFALHANERIATDRLIEVLWGDDPPPTADKALQGHVSALRKLLGADRIRTEDRAYRLVLEHGELDVDRFTATVAASRTTEDPGDRARLLGEALDLWRGEPLADVGAARFAGPEVARLEAAHLAALEVRIDAELALGRHTELLPELEQLVQRHPLAEHLRALLMLALYRAGRQSDALRAYHDGRRRLSEELGLDPGAELQQLERQILGQDPALAPPPPARPAARPRQERKTVTVLVVEARSVGATDPEDLAGLAAPALGGIRRVIERLGGRPEPLFTNAMLGIFGAPRAHEDDPLRAVRTALELRAGPGAPGLDLRGGIETGEALVTIDGQRVEVAGEVLAAAARLQASAGPGTFAIGPATRRLTEDAVEYRETGSGVWSPEGLRTVVAAGVEAPFIGRADELGLLERLYARARDEASVQLVTVTAEPGGGKSRLVRELRVLLDASPAPPTWRQGRCLPYGDGVTFWALAEVVKAEAGILESDDSRTSASKLAAAIANVEPDEGRRTWLERGLAALAGVEGAAIAGSHEQSFAVWRQFLEAIAAQGPLVLVFEDIHWAVPALLEFIEHLTSHASGVPLLVLCTARHELRTAHPSWGRGARNTTAIALEPLSAADTERLLQSLLGRTPGASTIRRAGGNPLFAHELARLGRTESDPTATIPESLQAVIAARLDALQPDAKALAADAAVVGEVFWSGAVAAMGGLEDAEAEIRLQGLVASDVARRRRSSSVARQSEYAFLHALVRDVAYRQIPRRERIVRHRAAGEWIERLAGDRITSHAELIAHHFVQALELATALADDAEVADLVPRARRFLTLAGDGASTLDMAQAESFYRRALDLTPPDDPAHGMLLARLGEVAHWTGRLALAEELSRAAIDQLRAHRDAAGAGEAMLTLLASLWRLGRPEAQRRAVVREAVATLEALEPGAALVRAYSQMAAHELHAGRADACGEWARKALAIADRLALPALKVQPLHHIGIARFESGDEAGIEDIREAVRLGLEAGLSQESATAQSNLAATTWVTDGPAAALAVKHAAAELAASRGLTSLERQIRAESLWQQHDAGVWDEALASADQVLAWDREPGASRMSVMAQTVKARILADRARSDEARALEQAYLGRARELGDPQDLGPALAAAAALRQAEGDPAAAAELIAELEMVTRGRDPSQRVHELPLAARVCREAGRITLAESLVPARGAPTYTRARLCLAAAAAEFAEAHADPRTASELHAVAANGWRAFGAPLEEAHSRLGRARCLAALGRAADAAAAAREALAIGRRLEARGVTGEAQALLAPGGRGQQAASAPAG